jgi:hypothetical protein
MMLTLRVSCQQQPVLYQAIFDVVVVVVRSFVRIVVPVHRNILTLVCIGDLLLLLPGENLSLWVSFSLLSRSPVSSFLPRHHTSCSKRSNITIDFSAGSIMRTTLHGQFRSIHCGDNAQHFPSCDCARNLRSGISHFCLHSHEQVNEHGDGVMVCNLDSTIDRHQFNTRTHFRPYISAQVETRI